MPIGTTDPIVNVYTPNLAMSFLKFGWIKARFAGVRECSLDIAFDALHLNHVALS